MVSHETDTDTSDTWLTYQEAAKCLGLSVNAVKLRVSRGKLLASRGNDGHPRVLLPVSAQVSKVSIVSTDTIPRHDTTPTPLTPEPMMPVSKALALVEAQQARADAQAARHLAERDALHLGHVDRLLAQAGMERQLWLERVDAAELRAERVEQRLDQIIDHLLQRSEPASSWRGWLGRWLGTSKKSEIGR